MSVTFATSCYSDQQDPVSWGGFDIQECDEFRNFMSNEVSSRLHDEEGITSFEADLRGLATTGFAHQSLSDILNAAADEERDWAVGEAIAEVWLEEEHSVIWPWNTERDKKVASASLPGADLVGFQPEGNDVRLVLGEVKSSSQAATPPTVMSGRSGDMGHQIDNLANNLGLIYQLLFWLHSRCKNTPHWTNYQSAVSLYLNSGNKAVSLFGILIRDTSANVLDLRARGRALGTSLAAPTSCRLIALYLPCAIADLPNRVAEGGSV